MYVVMYLSSVVHACYTFSPSCPRDSSSLTFTVAMSHSIGHSAFQSVANPKAVFLLRFSYQNMSSARDVSSSLGAVQPAVAPCNHVATTRSTYRQTIR